MKVLRHVIQNNPDIVTSFTVVPQPHFRFKTCVQDRTQMAENIIVGDFEIRVGVQRRITLRVLICNAVAVCDAKGWKMPYL